MTASQQKQRDLKYNVKKEKQFMIEQKNLKKEIDVFADFMCKDR